MKSHETVESLFPLKVTKEEKRRIVQLFSRHINRGQVQYLKAGHLDVLESRRRGAGFTDPETGFEMIDCFTSAGCFNVGRSNQELLKSLDEALDMLDMGDHTMVSPYKAAFAGALVEIAPGDLDHVITVSGGGDAVDGAIKLARGATGRRGVISTVKAYHGHTGFALSANGKAHYRSYCEPLMPDFHFVPFNDPGAMKLKAGPDIAAIIIEPVQGEAGIYVADGDYLRELRGICDRHGIMLIFDEVQTGFCRTGRIFACEHSGVTPDIMAVAKSMGGGVYPNGAILYRGRPELMKFVNNNPGFHRSVSGGSDLGCFVSLKVIEFIKKNRLWENAQRMGELLKKELEIVREENPGIIKEVRGIGLMIGIEYIHEFMGPMMSDALAKNGVFAAYSGNAPQVMRFMPPLTIREEEIQRLMLAVRRSVDSMKTLLPLALPAAKIPFVLKLLNSERVQTVLFNWIRSLEDLYFRLAGNKRK
ncbi:MAG TPA: aspartate aminotransferase family protein [Spirochaetes bacterium]|nr:aspartate aminotransferase family protein [Spirochaetota bacterium]